MVQPGERQRHDEHTDPGGDELDGVGGGGGALQGGPSGQALRPGEHVVEGVQHDVVGQVPGGDPVGGRDEVVLRHHDDGLLGVERDGAEHRTVDGQPDQARVGLPVQQQPLRRAGGHLGEG